MIPHEDILEAATELELRSNELMKDFGLTTNLLKPLASIQKEL